MSNMNRYWINQPSTLQPDHKYHGRRVLADTSDEDGDYCRCWFADGPVVNMRVAKTSLSKGWPQDAAAARFEVLTDTLCGGLKNVWTGDDDTPMTFATRQEADTELDEHVVDSAAAAAEGMMEDSCDRADFRIRPAGATPDDCAHCPASGTANCNGCDENPGNR